MRNHWRVQANESRVIGVLRTIHKIVFKRRCRGSIEDVDVTAIWSNKGVAVDQQISDFIRSIVVGYDCRRAALGTDGRCRLVRYRCVCTEEHVAVNRIVQPVARPSASRQDETSPNDVLKDALADR